MFYTKRPDEAIVFVFAYGVFCVGVEDECVWNNSDNYKTVSGYTIWSDARSAGEFIFR
jgi:hypothetical protein